MKKSAVVACPCGGPSLQACCGRYLAGEPAPTAEALMRSRYTAYVLRDEPYLQASWHASTRPHEPVTQDGLKWMGLEIRAHRVDPQDAGKATVEFVARFKDNGRAQRLHEISNFVREESRWYYVDGTFPERQ